MMVNLNGVETLYYGYADNQGSLIALTDVSGNIVEKYAFDPWGARRNPNDWTQKDTRASWWTNRGYTGHEHLDAFGIINMNGRVYDPLTATFFSPDPFIQSAGDWKNYNRYSYCMNNPTKYTDPSGYRYADQVEQPLEQREYLPFTNHGGSGGGLSDWSNHQGPISYNDRNGRFEYASGAEASTKEAMRNQQIDVPATLDLGFQIAKQQGWAGDYTDFTTLYSQRTAKNSYNGTFTLHTVESFYVAGGAGLKQTGSISLILEKGLGGSGSSLSNINTGLGIFGALNSIGAEIVHDYVSYGFKSANGWQEFGKLASNQQAWRAARVLGNTGANVLKYAKGIGYLGAAAGVGIATYQLIEKPTIGNATRLAVQGAAVGAVFIPVVGWGVSLGIGAADLIWGDQFYNWIDKQ